MFPLLYFPIAQGLKFFFYDPHALLYTFITSDCKLYDSPKVNHQWVVGFADYLYIILHPWMYFPHCLNWVWTPVYGQKQSP